MPLFVPAAQLGRQLYAELLAPALTGIPHAAGLFGTGSDVLGYDTERSTDHDWGPRATIFVDPAQVILARARLEAAIPAEFRGWPVRSGTDGPTGARHVVVTTWAGWLAEQLGDVPVDLKPVDWLLFPQQHLLVVTTAPVFADPDSLLTAVRRRLAWYPDDVWWWLLACQWRRIAQEEAFVQRTAEVGDTLGSVVIAARLARDVIRMALLIERRYAPYPKWLGTAFARLPHPDGLDRQLARALAGTDTNPGSGISSDSGRPGREPALARAYELLARRYLALPGTGDLDPTPRPYYDRPALVLGADRFVTDALARVHDRQLRDLPLIGAVDQFADNTDLLTDVGRLRRLRHLYGL